MNLESFFKRNFEEDPGAALQDLLRAVLIRAQFLPTVRHVIGWRGLKQASADPEGWTAKVGGRAGVFGLFFMEVIHVAGWYTGRFGLCYFPDPAEPLVERCSLKAAAFTQAGDYLVRVRDFPRHPEMCGLFAIGTLALSVRADRRALAMGMESATRLRTVASDGVRLTRGGESIALVEPGGFDQDFPAFETANAFFDVLAASVSFNLEQPPGFLIERRFPASRKVYDRTGAVSSKDDPGLSSVLIALGFGNRDFDDLLSAVSSGEDAQTEEMKADGPEAAPLDYRDRIWWRAHRLKDSRSIDKKFLGVDDRPPLILLTGFLGAGKTSFLQRFIEYQTQRSRFVAVIQNEIGEVGLDGRLLDYTVTEIDEGCVCCSLEGNLKRAVHGILSNFSPDAIILETSGLANPLNLLDDMAALDEVVRFDSTVTLVDDARLAAVRRRVREINPGAPLFDTTHGNLNPALFFDAGDPADPAGEGGESTAGSATLGASSANPAHAEAGIWSKTLRLPGPLDRDRFLQAVSSLPASIFRVKGAVDFTDSEGMMLFQYVCGRFELSVFPKRGANGRFLTFIGGENEPDSRDLLEALSPAPASGD